MRKISSAATFSQKRVFPAICFGFIGFAIVAAFVGMLQRGRFEPLPIIIPSALAIIFYIVMKNFVWVLVDEVWDDGDELVVRNGRIEERVALSNITNIGYTTSSRPPRVTLTLRQRGQFGEEINFCPLDRRFFGSLGFSKSPIVDELIERVDAARQR
jgi:hypothetical protein